MRRGRRTLLRRSYWTGRVQSFWSGSFSSAQSPDVSDDSYVQRELFEIYSQHVAPLEKEFDFAKFHTPSLTRSEFMAPPLVLLLGQYSTGKVCSSWTLTICFALTGPHQLHAALVGCLLRRP